MDNYLKMIKKHTRPNSRHARPHLWKTGPDPLLRRRYYQWMQQRNQAQWRGETWNISFEAWQLLWQDLWDLRGRTRSSLCMSRQDWELPWTTDNVIIVTREVHARAQGLARAAGWCSLAQRTQRGRRRQGELDLEQIVEDMNE